MKVERDAEFKPIHITIETEEEADVMWHLLNVSTSNFNRIVEEHGRSCKGDAGTSEAMWHSFKPHHHPQS